MALPPPKLRPAPPSISNTKPARFVNFHPSAIIVARSPLIERCWWLYGGF